MGSLRRSSRNTRARAHEFKALQWTVNQHLRARAPIRLDHVTLTTGAAALAVASLWVPFRPEAVRPTAGMAACAGRRCHAKSSGPIELLKLGDGVRSRSRELRSGTSIKISWSKRSGRLQLGTHLMRDFALARAYARIPEFAPDFKPGSLDLARSPEKREYSVHIKDRENPGTR